MYHGLKIYIPARNLRSEREGYLVVPRMPIKTFGERAFSFAAAVENGRMKQITK